MKIKVTTSVKGLFNRAKIAFEIEAETMEDLKELLKLVATVEAKVS